MSHLEAEYGFLTDGWRLAGLLTGCRHGAAKCFLEAVQDVARHPHTGDLERLRTLFFARLRLRCLKFPAVCELSGSSAKLHELPEPGRSALALEVLGALPLEEICRVLDLNKRAVSAEIARTQTALDPAADPLGGLLDIEPDGDVVSESARTLHATQAGGKLGVRNPALIAVGVGFLLLVGVLIWNMLGGSGDFPEEALKITSTGSRAGPDSFEAADERAGDLGDWFVLKGFDAFRLPPGMENLPAIGVRLFKVENESVAQVAVADDQRPMLYLYAFQGRPFGISVPPEKSWRVAQSDRSVLAIREDKGVCFIISFRGKRPDMEKFLRTFRVGVER